MKQNAFDKDFDIAYDGRYGHATFEQPGKLPIIELHRVEIENNDWGQKKKFMWFITELTMTDDIINEVLPSDWQVMKYRGFKDIKSFKKWVTGL